MIQIVDANGWPMDPRIFHRTTRIARASASRRLGKDWRKRGYTVAYWPLTK